MTHDLSTRDGFDRELVRRIKMNPGVDQGAIHEGLLAEAKPIILAARLARLSSAVHKPHAHQDG